MSSKFVKLTCSECGEIFLLEADFAVPGEVAKETPTCRQLNLMRHRESFEDHKHQATQFKWEVAE